MAGAATRPAQSTPATPPESPQPGGRKPMPGLVIGAIVAGVIAAQIGVTYLLMRETAPSNDATARSERTHSGTEHDPEHDADREESAEIALGEFSFSNTAAVPGIIMHVDFKLTALALPSQSAILESQIKRSRERVRETINKVVRSASYDELIDPNLGTLKRMMRDELNRMLDKSLIGEVVINDIRILQQ